jgi:hypothetical protein
MRTSNFEGSRNSTLSLAAYTCSLLLSSLHYRRGLLCCAPAHCSPSSNPCSGLKADDVFSATFFGCHCLMHGARIRSRAWAASEANPARPCASHDRPIECTTPTSAITLCASCGTPYLGCLTVITHGWRSFRANHFVNHPWTALSNTLRCWTTLFDPRWNNFARATASS